MRNLIFQGGLESRCSGGSSIAMFFSLQSVCGRHQTTSLEQFVRPVEGVTYRFSK